ncbi:hypothetical protein FPQ18DRAFT_302661 [Pyronema domesticum]|nr:hypothetical protein FPQ18DRAFT_302661 [Pyronema domesticum]
MANCTNTLPIHPALLNQNLGGEKTSEYSNPTGTDDDVHELVPEIFDDTSCVSSIKNKRRKNASAKKAPEEVCPGIEKQKCLRWRGLISLKRTCGRNPRVPENIEDNGPQNIEDWIAEKVKDEKLTAKTPEKVKDEKLKDRAPEETKHTIRQHNTPEREERKTFENIEDNVRAKRKDVDARKMRNETASKISCDTSVGKQPPPPPTAHTSLPPLPGALPAVPLATVPPPQLRHSVPPSTTTTTSATGTSKQNNWFLPAIRPVSTLWNGVDSAENTSAIGAWSIFSPPESPAVPFTASTTITASSRDEKLSEIYVLPPIRPISCFLKEDSPLYQLCYIDIDDSITVQLDQTQMLDVHEENRGGQDLVSAM